MRLLTKCQDGVFATALAQALDAAGIGARVTSEIENAYISRLDFVVWVAEEADSQKIAAVCRAFQAQNAPRISSRATRVSPVE